VFGSNLSLLVGGGGNFRRWGLLGGSRAVPGMLLKVY
jgi:hypothetical protein